MQPPPTFTVSPTALQAHLLQGLYDWGVGGAAASPSAPPTPPAAPAPLARHAFRWHVHPLAGRSRADHGVLDAGPPPPVLPTPPVPPRLEAPAEDELSALFFDAQAAGEFPASGPDFSGLSPLSDLLEGARSPDANAWVPTSPFPDDVDFSGLEELFKE